MGGRDDADPKRQKLNGVDPIAWLTDVLERVVSGRTKAHELHKLLPWNWRPTGNAGIWPRLCMIDNSRLQAERLLARLQTALPLPARVTPELGSDAADAG